MDDLLDYFAHIPSSYRAGLVLAGLAFFWSLEVAIPLFRFSNSKVRHALLNLFFWALFLSVALLFAGLIFAASRLSEDWGVGVLHLVHLPTWANVVVGLLILDLISAYFIHWIEHKVRWMWKFHLVHHSDTEVDVTTGLRHHPGEAVFRSVFTVLAVFVSGASIGVALLYQSLSVLFTQITHVNVASPPAVDRLISWVFVTPNMHRVHHHYVQPLTDTNYGNIFSIWDRLFGTFASVDRIDELKFGIDTHMRPEENSDVKNLIRIPFQKFRPPPGSKFSED